MFRQFSTFAFVVCTALGSLALPGCRKPAEPAKSETVAPQPAPSSKPAGPPKELALDLGNGVKLQMVRIPAGEFLMGSDEPPEVTAAYFKQTYGEQSPKPDDFQDEHPQHRVRITRPFYLGAHHVTRGQFRQFVADTGYKTDAEKGEKPGAFGLNPDKKTFGFNADYSWRNAGFPQTDKHPVVCVSWDDAVAFCKWLGGKQGKTYRLPTEAEWEYACRAGTTSWYSCGDDPEALATVGNVADAAGKAQFPLWKGTIKASDGFVFTSPVGSFKPNAFGLYDMHGNPWQWCADWYDARYYKVSPTDDPRGLKTGTIRVRRGGSWSSPVRFCRSASRGYYGPGFTSDLMGFRVAGEL
jgi:formylglycine-generating enzyme required for sulfatase activity